ncbi:hypothetical protein Lal_00013571 [Lupinus albus]|nr:hypothetical protein Lal_00013571 [Lupinus albus]
MVMIRSDESCDLRSELSEKMFPCASKSVTKIGFEERIQAHTQSHHFLISLIVIDGDDDDDFGILGIFNDDSRLLSPLPPSSDPNPTDTGSDDAFVLLLLPNK